MSDNLQQLQVNLTRLAVDLDKLNSAYPATQDFLAQRGLNLVSQLDEAGRRDLVEYLRGELAKLLT